MQTNQKTSHRAYVRQDCDTRKISNELVSFRHQKEQQKARRWQLYNVAIHPVYVVFRQKKNDHPSEAKQVFHEMFHLFEGNKNMQMRTKMT